MQWSLFAEEARSRSYVDWYEGPREQRLTTPREVFAWLDGEYCFTLDGAADSETALLPRFSAFDDHRSWAQERVFCNPPWSNIAPFVELAATAELAVLLVPARVNARWFHRALALGARPRFFQGKLRFGQAKWNSPVDCLLLIWGVE